MAGFLNDDGSELVGGKLPSGQGEALNLDANGNLLVSLGATASAQSTGSVTNDGETVSINVTGQQTALVQLLGTFTLTVLFEASPDGGTTWYSVSGVQGTGTIASSATAPGYWRVNVAGFTNFRVRAHPITSGSANSTSVVIASDQNVPVKAATQEIIGNGTGVVNAVNTDLISSTDVSAYKWLSLQIQGTYNATLSFQASNDNVNWVAVKLILFTSYVDNNAASSTTGTGQIWCGPVTFRYFRVRATAFTSNASLAGTLELYAVAPFLPITNPTAFLVPQAAGGTSDYHLISAASTNANNIKASNGQVYGYELGNNGASDAWVKLYDTSGAPTAGSGTPKRVIYVPKGQRVGFHTTTGIQFNSGIGLTITGGAADNDTTAVGAAQITVEIDYK